MPRLLHSTDPDWGLLLLTAHIRPASLRRDRVAATSPEYCVEVTALDRLPRIGAPATRALEAAGYTSLSDLAGVSRAHLAELHGVGPRAIEIIQAALEEHDLTLS